MTVTKITAEGDESRRPARLKQRTLDHRLGKKERNRHDHPSERQNRDSLKQDCGISTCAGSPGHCSFSMWRWNVRFDFKSAAKHRSFASEYRGRSGRSIGRVWNDHQLHVYYKRQRLIGSCPALFCNGRNDAPHGSHATAVADGYSGWDVYKGFHHHDQHGGRIFESGHRTAHTADYFRSDDDSRELLSGPDGWHQSDGRQLRPVVSKLKCPVFLARDLSGLS